MPRPAKCAMRLLMRAPTRRPEPRPPLHTFPEAARINTVTSRDGTTIAFDRSGEGPPVILDGWRADRSSNAPLAALLAPHFTVFNHDRRGRGRQRERRAVCGRPEYDDIEALIAEAGRSVYAFGSSGGGMIGLEA
jgi:Alpha/beta hydrolase family